MFDFIPLVRDVGEDEFSLFFAAHLSIFFDALLVLLEVCAEENAPANKEKQTNNFIIYSIRSNGLTFLCESNVER